MAPAPTSRRAVLTSLAALATLAPTRGHSVGTPTRFFSRASAWNTPIPQGCTFTSPGDLRAVDAGIDALDDAMAWSIPFYVAQPSDPLRPLLYNPAAWGSVAAGHWKRRANGKEMEGRILSSSPVLFPFPGNVFSSTSTVAWRLPPSFNATRNPRPAPATFRIGSRMYPATGLDGHMTVLQPDGRVLETYATIVLGSGTVVAMSWSLTDPSGLGDGWENGQTASMLPAYAGLIDEAELTSGTAHAMAITLPARLLAPGIRYPAYAFDRNALTATPPYAGLIPMGGRLALPAAVDIAALGLETPEGLVMARAAQTYGFIAVDRGGGGITVRMRPGPLTPRPGFPGWRAALRRDLRRIVRGVQLAVFTRSEIRGGR